MKKSLSCLKIQTQYTETSRKLREHHRQYRRLLRSQMSIVGLLIAIFVATLIVALPAHARISRRQVEISDVGVYTGQMETDGVMDGKGMMKYLNGEVYNGQWKDGLRDGKGKMTYMNGDVYEGEWSEGKRQGKGKLKTHTGEVYEGEWVDDDLRYGKLKYSSTGEYTGYFKDLKLNGYGVRKYGGHTVEGLWRDNLREGVVKDTDRNGTVTWAFYQDGVLSPLKVATDGQDMGIDISRYQDTIVWDNLYFFNEGTEPDYRINGTREGTVSPVKFVIIKATEGGDHIDPKMAEHAENAERYNYPRGFYHFYNTTSSASANAANFISKVELEPHDLPPILDIEVDGEEVDSLVHWMELIEKHYGRKPMIYTNERFYQKYVEGTPLEKYPLWYSRYGRKDIDRGAEIFQFTETGLMDGIKGHTVDVNVIPRGTVESIIGQPRK